MSEDQSIYFFEKGIPIVFTFSPNLFKCCKAKIVKQRYQINVLSVYHQSLDLISVKSLYFNGYGIRWFLERKFCRQFDANIVHNNIDNMFFHGHERGWGVSLYQPAERNILSVCTRISHNIHVFSIHLYFIDLDGAPRNC